LHVLGDFYTSGIFSSLSLFFLIAKGHLHIGSWVLGHGPRSLDHLLAVWQDKMFQAKMSFLMLRTSLLFEGLCFLVEVSDG
jgi:hypothetical protein